MELNTELLLDKLKSEKCKIHGLFADVKIQDGKVMYSNQCCDGLVDQLNEICTEFRNEELKKAVLRGFNKF